MILALKNGQLIPPTSPVEGHKRMQALTAECSRIELQLRNPTRKRAFEEGKIPGDYDAWKRAAEQALRMHNLERRLLGEWLEREVFKLLSRVDKFHADLVEDETELSDEEQVLIEEVAAYVRAREIP